METMPDVKVLSNEKERIETIKKYNILDTPPDGNFDRITTLASTFFKVPIAIISIVDTDRIWFKSHHGLSISQISKTSGLCASAILSTDPYVVENAIEDPRTLINPLVAGDFGLRFYAAAPLQTENNLNLGTLCIIDKEPRVFSELEVNILQQLAAVVMDEMEMRLSLRKAIKKIKSVSVDVSGHLKDSIRNIETVAETGDKTKLVSYLDASRLFLTNIENELDNIA